MAGAIKAKLGDNLDIEPRGLCGGDLCGQRALEFVLADPRMALRVAGDSDGADAAPPKKTAVDNIKRAPQRAALAAVAGNDQDTVHCRFALKPR